MFGNICAIKLEYYAKVVDIDITETPIILVWYLSMSIFTLPSKLFFIGSAHSC